MERLCYCRDYWNLTSAVLKLTGSYNTSIAYPPSTDVTANFGFENMTIRVIKFFAHSYTWAEPACTAPYAPCAPRGLAWTCNDQVKKIPH